MRHFWTWAANRLTCNYQNTENRAELVGEPHAFTKYLILRYKKGFSSQMHEDYACLVISQKALSLKGSVGEEMREGRRDLLLYITQFLLSF